MEPDPRVAGFLGRVLDGEDPVGTCFQVAPGVLATAFHVLDHIGAAEIDAVVPVDPLQGGAERAARVRRLDPLHDLAVLTTDEPLPASVAGLAPSDDVATGTTVVVTGVGAGLDDPGHTSRDLPADGHWVGGTTRDDQIRLGVVDSKRVLRGMSGAPVVVADGRVVGVVSARYNSIDGWGRDTVWVARTEDLAALLSGLTDVALLRRRTGPVELMVSVTDTQVRLHGAGVDVTAAHAGVSRALADAVRGLGATRAQLTRPRAADPLIGLGPAGSPPASQGDEAIVGRWLPPGAMTPAGVGRLLAEQFLPGSVAAALAEVLADAQSRWAPVLLGIDVDGPLRGLPWETLALPAARGPAALHPLLVVYRHARAGAGRSEAPAALSVGGPLRVVVAIAAPLDGGGGVLDYERELRNVLAAVRAARQGPGVARVRIVHFATTAEIYAELAAEPAHVLHLSGHGRPGVLEIEDDDGNAREITAATFVAEAIPPRRMPPVIALAACHTDAATAAGDPSFAASLVAHGARVVIGTETAVTDVYTTRVFAHIYAELAAAEVPEVVAAVARARRSVHDELTRSPDLRDRRLAALGEWAVLSVLATAGTLPLFDPNQPPPGPADLLAAESRPRAGAGVVPVGLLARDVGEFVGRRRAQRRWPAQLLAPGGVGLVLHGIGGVGKTTLAAELVGRITEREPQRRVVVAASGLIGATLTVDAVLAAIARALRPADAPRSLLAQVADVLDRVDVEWQQRWAVLAEHVLNQVPLLLVLDNFEDNLTPTPAGRPAGAAGRAGWWSVADPDLALLLATLVTRPGRARLLVTSRYPFLLAGHADRVLSWQPIGPLSHAETMKLAWALPGLDRLTEPELERVNQLVGGHPRCLEYLDALLRGGHSRYPDVTARLLGHLGERLDTDDLDGWLAAHQALEPAIAAVLVQAADEVLLDRLLAQLTDTPGAEELLLGLSVYRRSVDDAGLLFEVGHPDPDAATSPAAARQRILETITNAGIPIEGPIDPAALPPAVQQAIATDLDRLQQPPHPPLRAPQNLRRLLQAAAASSLLAIDTNREPAGWFLHRWTAAELARRWTHTGRHPQLIAAHRRAADYWQWRVQVWPQDRAADLDDLDEARHHVLAAGELDHANDLSWAMVEQLHARGAWDREDALIRDTLSALPDTHPGRSNWIRQLADIANGRSRVAEAEHLYRQALAIDERLVELAPDNTDFQRNLSVSHNKLGDLAREGGDRAEATRLFQAGLAITERLVELAPDNTGFQRDLSVSHQRLGDLAREAGDRAEATRRYQQFLVTCERLVELAPDNTDFQQIFFNSCDRLADLAADDKDAAATVDHALQFAVNLLGRDHPLPQAIQRRLDDPSDGGARQPTP